MKWIAFLFAHNLTSIARCNSLQRYSGKKLTSAILVMSATDAVHIPLDRLVAGEIAQIVGGVRRPLDTT